MAHSRHQIFPEDTISLKYSPILHTHTVFLPPIQKDLSAQITYVPSCQIYIKIFMKHLVDL